MATATFSGNSSYQLEGIAVRSGKDIYVDVYVNRVGSYLAWSTAQQSWSATIDGVKQDGTWTYDFRNSTRVYLGRFRRNGLAIGNRPWSAAVSMASGIGSASVSGTVTIPPDAPSAPTLNSVLRSSDTQHTIHWTRNASSSAPYHQQGVQRRIFSGGVWAAWTTVATIETDYTNSGANQYTDTTTVANRVYQYRIAAYNSAGGAASGDSVLVYTTPAQTVVTAESISTTQVRIDLAPATNAVKYVTDIEYSSAGGPWTTLVQLASGVKTYTWTPPAAAAVQFRVRVVIVDDGTVGGNFASLWSYSNTVPLQSPPLAPTSLAPNGKNLDAAKAATFSWAYTSVDTSAQSAYEIETQAGSGAAWVSRGKVTSSAKSATFAAGTFTKGVAYNWRVRTWGVHPDPSPFSTPASFTFVDAPSVTITQPLGVIETSTATVKWNAVAGQASWKVELLRESELVETRSGSGSTTSVTLKTPLANNITYTIRVQVQASSGLWSEWASTTFLSDFPTPAEAGVALGWDTERGAVLVTVENVDGTPRNRAKTPSFEKSGSVSAIVRRNLHINPGGKGSAGFSGYSGGTGNAQSLSEVDAPWSFSGKARRSTWTQAAVPGGDLSPIVRHALDAEPVNTWMTLEVSWQVSHATSVQPPQLYSGSGGVVQGIRSRTTDTAAVPGVTYRDWITFRCVDNPVRSYDGNTRVVFNPRPMTAGFYMEMSDVDIYLGDYRPNREWFYGSTPAAGDYTYAWEAAENQSFSYRKGLAAAGVDPAAFGNVVGYQSSEWAAEGSKSLRLTAIGTATGTSLTQVPVSLLAGKTYTLQAVVRLTAPIAGAFTHALKMRFNNGGFTSASEAAPNAAGEHVITWTVTPTVDQSWLQLWHGGSVGQPDVWWDRLMIVEGTEPQEFFDGDSPGASWDGTAGESTSSKADTESNTIYRSYDGVDWELVQAGVPADATISDAEVRLNDEVLYKVLSVSPLGTITESDVYPIYTESKQGYWSVGPGFSMSVGLRINLGGPPSIDFEQGLAYKELHYFAGRTLPVEFAGTARQRSGEASFMVSSVAERNQAVQMSYMPAPHLFRLPDGELVYASITPLSVHREDEGFYTLEVSLQEVER